ncbi:hypothetical protein U1Q18_051547 [Sarracenia purpurea var. burkii]
MYRVGGVLYSSGAYLMSSVESCVDIFESCFRIENARKVDFFEPGRAREDGKVDKSRLNVG